MSDTTVISPQPGEAVITTSTHGGHDNHRGHHPDNWDLSAQMQRDLNTTGAELQRGFTAGALASCKTDDAVAGVAKDSAVGFKDQLVTAYQVESRGLLEAAKNASQVQIQADKNFYASQVEAVKNAAAVALQIATGKADSDAKAAACCCAIEERITAEAVATRGLIETNEKARLLDVIAQQRSQLAAYFSRNLPPVVPGAV